MRKIVQSLEYPARKMLLEGKSVSLLEAGVLVQPDKSGRATGFVSRFVTPLGTDPAWLADELTVIRNTCADAEKDISGDSLAVIQRTVRLRGRELPLWVLSWPALMLMNNGNISIDLEQFVYRSVLDSDTTARVEQRMRSVKEGMERILGRLRGVKPDTQ